MLLLNSVLTFGFISIAPGSESPIHTSPRCTKDKRAGGEGRGGVVKSVNFKDFGVCKHAQIYTRKG